MSTSDTTLAALTYAVVWLIAAVVGLAIAGFGTIRWVVPAVLRYGQGAPVGRLLSAMAPGLLLVLVGLAVWKVTTTLVLYRSLSIAIAAVATQRLNTETMKSDILAVLDERLADMKGDTQRTRRIVERASSEDAADEFEFSAD